MTAEARAAMEGEVRRLCEEGAFGEATVLTVRAYGPEILGLLFALHASEADADEVFSIWSERAFRGLPGFHWTASLRTWVYAVARNASLNFARGARVRGQRERAARTDEIIAVAQQVRTATPPYLRTEARSKLAAIRDALPPEDRLLLVLRVDKRLDWKDLARVMLGADDGEVGEVALAKESQRLRKRFQLVKERLLEAGRRAGILGNDDRG